MYTCTKGPVLIALSLWFALMPLATPVFAQNTTQGQRDLAAEIQDDRDRRDQAARAQQGQDAARTNYNNRKAQEAFEARDRVEGPARAAAAAAERARQAQASAAQDAMLAQMRASRMAEYERGIAEKAYSGVGYDRLKAGDFAGALPSFQQVAALAPRAVYPLEGRALAKSGLGDFAGALADINTAMIRFPGEYLEKRAEIRAAQGDATGARADYDQLLTTVPKYINAWIGRGKLRLVQGDQVGGLSDLKQALIVNKDYKPAIDALEVAQAKIERRPLNAEVAARVAPVVTDCDRLAAAGYDDSRPYTMPWVDTIDKPTAAIAACRLEAARLPVSSRTKFQLGRALLAATQCDEAVTLLKSSVEEGSAAALVLYGNLSKSICKANALADPLPTLEHALKIGSGQAASILADRYYDIAEANKANMTTEEYNKMIYRIVAYRQTSMNIYKDRADITGQGRGANKYAIFVLANYASRTGTSLVGPNAAEFIHKCIALEYEPCMKYTFPQK